MMNFKKTVLSITLALAVIAPTAVYAASTNVAPNGGITLSEKKVQLTTIREDKINARNAKNEQKKVMLQARIVRHEKKFQTADVIVPGTLDKGMAVLNERIELRKQINDLRKKNREAMVLPLKEELKAGLVAIKEKITKGELTKADAKVKILALQQEKKTKIQNIKDEFKKQYETEKTGLKVKREAVSESYKNFTLAVKSKNAATIESTFDIYLKNSNELNVMLKGLIKQITL